MIFAVELMLGAIVLFEYRNYKIVATPAVILGGVYFLFVPLINTVGVKLGFLKVTNTTMLWFTLFVFVLFVFGMPFSVYYNRCISKEGGERYDLYEKLDQKKSLIWWIYLFSLVCYVISLLQVISRYGINNTKSNAFGPFAHVGFLSRCLLPFIILYFLRTKKLKYLFAVLVNLVALVMFRGKYHLFIPIAGFIVLFLITKKNINIKKIILAVIGALLAGALLFISVYTVIPNLLAGETSWDVMSAGMQFSLKHFFHYLFCPFICSNAYFANPVYRTLEEGLRTNFNAIDVLREQFLGNRAFFGPEITFWAKVDEAGTTTNVGGLFSESVLNIGFVLSFLYVAVIGVVVYYFTIKCLLRGRRIVTAMCLAGTMMMSFFCNYFSLLPNIECLVYGYLFDVFLMDSRRRIKGISIRKIKFGWGK